jgi:hypothetical protein
MVAVFVWETTMKSDDRNKLHELVVPALQHSFEHGMAYQRLLDAQADEEFAEQQAKASVKAVLDLINIPEKEELN